MRAAAEMALVWALLTAALAGPARAQTKNQDVVVVLVDPGGSGLDPEKVRRAVADELRATVGHGPTPNAAGTLTVRVEASGELFVSYRDRAGSEVSRVVDLPEDAQRRLDVIALLSGNLARNEATSLAETLRPKPAPREEAPPVEETPEAAEAKPKRKPAPAAQPPRLDAASAQDASAPRDAPSMLPHVAANASLFFPIAVNPHSHERRIHFEAGLAYSRIGALQGFGVSIGYQRVERDANGVLVAGIASRVGGDTRGAAVSGIYGATNGTLHGVEAAGIANLRGGGVQGIQISGIVNRAHGDVAGAQASLINIGGNVDGLQLGLVNVAGRVRGVQAGLVNVADQVDGLSFGLANVIRKGRTQIVGWGDTVTLVNVGVKYVMGPLQSLVSVGVDPFAEELAPGLGLGGHFELAPFFVEPDVVYRYVFADLERVPDETQYHSVAYRFGAGFQASRRLGFVAGGGVEQQLPAVGGEYAVKPYAFAGIQFF